MGSKTSSQQNQQSTTTADPQAAADYDSTIRRAKQVSNTPYQAYTGELTAGVNAQENTATTALNGLGAAANGYYGQAAQQSGLGAAAVNPTAVDGSTIGQYMSPYQSNVIDATMAQIDQQNKIQQNQQTSSAIGAGAFGGDRAGLASAALAGQQALAANSTLAGLNNQNYAQALGEANTQQSVGLGAAQANRTALQQNAETLAGIGSAATSSGLGVANAQLGAGALQQQTQQAADTANYGQFEQAQAYPFQTEQYLANIVEGIAPNYGSSTTGQTTTETSPLNSIIGGGLGLAALAPKLFASGGVVGGTPYSDVSGYVPAGQGVASARMLSAPSGGVTGLAQQAAGIPNFSQYIAAGQNLKTAAGGLGNVASSVGNYLGGGMNSVGMFNFADGGKVVGLGAARGRRGYDSGGVVGSDALMFDPNAVGFDMPMAAGLGAAAPAMSFVPAPAAPNGAPSTPPPTPPQGLGAAQMPPPRTPMANDNTPVSVAPAPNPTPIVGYRQSDGTVTSPSAGGLGTAAAPSAGLGAAAAAPNGVAAINAAAPATTAGFGFNRSVARTLGFEGGLNSADTNGTPSNYGINQQAHPDIDVTKITPDQAKAIYKSDYWDAIDGDKLPPALAHVAFDTAVIAGPARANAMIAQSGGDPGKFMDLRDSYLDGLLQSDPSKYGKYTGAWSERSAALRSDIGAGGVPASALGYTGTGGGSGSAGLGLSGLPSSASSNGLGSTAPGILQGLSAADTSTSRGGGVAGALGFGAGGNGGLLGLSDDARMGLLSAAAGIMASPSKSPGIAIGQGVQQGLGAYQGQQKLGLDRARVQAEVANTGSQIQNRTALQGIERDKVTLAGQELGAHLQQIQQEGGNYKSEDAYRKAQTGNEATRVALERYQLYPGPDGSFRYLDKANPGRGLLTAAQVPELAAAGGGSAPPAAVGTSPTPGNPANTGSPASGGVSVPSGAPPASLNGPSALKSDGFLKTGHPTLAAPQGYLPTNWWGNNVRMQSDPVAREAAGAQTKEDVTNASVAAQKANTALYYSDEMDRNMDMLSKSGLLQPGAAFPERLNLAKSYNLAAGSLGLPTVDENATAAGQSLVKDQTRLASQLTSSLGSREAASVFSSMMAATPGASNTTAGYKGISSSIRVLAQRDIDRNAFIQNYQSRYGSTGEADVAFNALNPPMAYARQAQMLAKIPQQATDLLRSNASDPRAAASFEQVYGSGTARYFTGAQ